MSEDTLFIGLLVFLFFVFMIYVTVKNNRKRKQDFLKSALKNWGRAPQREYSYEEFESISHYAARHKAGRFYVDDITWNDLDMDHIFMLINNTISSCGEEYLYYMLRTPVFSQDVLDERDRLAGLFRERESMRLKVQRTLSLVGKTRGISLGDYIYRLSDIERNGNLKYILLGIAMAASIAGLFFYPGFAAILLPLILYNVTLYMRLRSELEAYVRCFKCILDMCSAAGRLEREHIPELEAYTEKLRRARLSLKKFCRGSFLVTSQGNIAGDITTAILMYLNMFFHFDTMKFNSMLKELDGHQEEVELLAEYLGILDAALATASFREYLPYYARGQFEMSVPLTMEAHDLYHPLIDEPVANSITAKGGTLVTGSNASGKSTFLKIVAINAILAQALDTAVCTSYRTSFLKVMTSMALADNLESSESYYIVEIKSLKRILDESRKDEPILCIIDEVLRGTNTIERIAASSQILLALRQDAVLPFAATHDIELSHILKKEYVNYHFEEEIGEEDIRFNYELKTGRTNTRNAIRLLELMGYDENIVKGAKKEAATFEETGVWESC